MKNKLRLLAISVALMTCAMPLTVSANVPDNVDTTVIDEEEEDPTPLTPEGNMTLVDDIVSSDNHSKEFLTVTTRNGNIFYIIVDRDNNTGVNNVHFLNQVDERDLLDVLSDEDKEALEASLGSKVETPVEPVVEPTPVEPEPEEPVKKSGPNPILGLIIVLGLAGVAGFYFYSNSESFKKKKSGEDPDSAYADDYIDIPEEDEKEEE
ncbi:DUF4366 domain-containing protein [Butyrivibrio sp. X503]|uniref:CD1107 family mobile element protein n=1 Tax=unclassified Butyrivibrio TaxID=2639466 RepID=UPI000EA920CF|nr:MULTISPECIES: DUF4366 domain-containing protein [unclassified Butyrivibrio]RKM55721.1 DUF4366 domain-containing protein [Butyrivibrio sp. X503]RKM63026.1 DUF4366 domain-containing protein [Butyrivibrio sp. XB500-5]